ncbi:MAG: hypothetical protein JJE49_00155 [Peptostreptococcaceae bacterium]|nr:hypothetical protein [Peptostreptococcaceae bacterium]
MLILLLGCLSFLIFIIYDINQIKGNLLWIKPFFSIGCLVLCGVTGVMILKPFESDISVYPFVLITFIFLAIISFLLLIYTLFFAIPFYEAYVADTKQNLCTVGVYSLCRHPGVLFFGFFYLFLGIGLGKPFVLLAGIVFTLMNIIYVFLQDKYFFPRAFKNYDHYQQDTNFLLPSRRSIKRCFKHYI